MLNILPHYTFTIQTQAPFQIVFKRLSEKVEPPKMIRFGWFRCHLPYEGTVSEDGFKISRVIHYRNSMLPIIRGRFERSVKMTLVQIDMNIHPASISFLIFFCFIWYGFGGIIALMSGWNGSTLLFLNLPTLLLSIFFCIFWLEAKKSRLELTSILLGQDTSQQVERDRVVKRRFRIAQVIGLILSIVTSLSLCSTLMFQKGTSSSQILGIGPNPCSGKVSDSVYCNFSLTHVIKGHPSASVVAISIDSKTLVSGGEDKALKIWDLTTGKLRKTIQSPSGKILALAISADGKTIVSGGSDSMVRIWDLATGKQKAMLKGHVGDIVAVAIRPDSKTLVSVSGDDVFKVWDIATENLQATYTPFRESQISLGPLIIEYGGLNHTLLALSANGNTALLREGNKALTWNLMTGRLQAEFKPKFQFFASSIISGTISPDGSIAVIQHNTHKHGGKIEIWDAVTGKFITHHHFTYFTNDGISVMPMVLDRQRIFGLNFDQKSLLVWNLTTQKLDAGLKIGSIESLVLSPDSKILVGTVRSQNSKNTQIKVWRNRSGQ
jgi:WD40 repeat protein